MTVIKGGKNKVTLKLSPKGRVVLAWKPRAYALTPQQKKVKECAIACGIHKGISREFLVRQMKLCIAPCMQGKPFERVGPGDYVAPRKKYPPGSIREAIAKAEEYERERDRR